MSSIKSAQILSLERRYRQQTGSLRFRQGIWRYSRAARQDDPTQGWKIHLSATVISAGEVFGRAFPILRKSGALFKVPAELALLADLNAGSPGFSQVGKFITVYTRSVLEAVALLRELHAATKHQAAPEVPFDRRYRRNGLIYYRYGAFAAERSGKPTQIFDSIGKPHLDRRAPGQAIPPWLVDPFRKRSARPKPSGPIGLDYFVFKALAQRGKGGVFEALDLSTSPARLVIIKQGRRHGDTDWFGEDGRARIKREGRRLRALRNSGIPVPQVFREFDHGGNHYLVLEKLTGRPLLPARREHPAKPSWRRAAQVFEKVGPLLRKLHIAGWVWRDCKPLHIFLHRDAVRVIDFEGACRICEAGLLPWGSPDYLPPIYRKNFAFRVSGTLEDDYALGVIAFQFGTGEFPPLNSRRRAACYRRTACPADLRERIEGLLQL